MRVTVSKCKNATILYLTKSDRVDGKSTTKTVEKLDALEEVKSRAGKMDPMGWAKAYAIKSTKDERNGDCETIIKYHDYKLIYSRIISPSSRTI